MKKINSDLYVRLMAQAQEANDLGLDDLSKSIKKSLPSIPDLEEYSINSEAELSEKINSEIWNICLSMAEFYNLKHVDAHKVNTIVNYISKFAIDTIKEELDVNEHTRSNEFLPGENNENLALSAFDKFNHYYKHMSEIESVNIGIRRSGNDEVSILHVILKDSSVIEDLPNKIAGVDIEYIVVE